jgi:hypothetical protein
VPRVFRLLVLVAAALIALAGVAVAQAEPAKATDAALAKVRASEKKRSALITERTTLAARYQKELAEIDKLKRQKASWRRDRQLRSKLSASLETAKKLGKASGAITILDGDLVKQRKALIKAIDAELAAGAASARAKSIKAARADAARKVAPHKAKKIVLPDDELDPLADPEELDQQAKALRDSEAELEKQIATLEREATRFRKQADLRKEHQRADELATRDDHNPRRTQGSSGNRGGGVTADEAAPQSDEGGSPPPDDFDGAMDPGAFEGDPAVVLSDVVDGDTVDALRKAERSTDPAAKAAAAERARDQVKRRLEKLEKRRREIEKRAKELRE